MTPPFKIDDREGLGVAPSKTNPQTPADVLRAAADLIAQPGAWGRAELARDKAGKRVRVDSPEASCFCVAGAAQRVTGAAVTSNALYMATYWAWIGATGSGFTAFNDAISRTQSEVVAKLREVADSLDAARPSNPSEEGR